MKIRIPSFLRILCLALAYLLIAPVHAATTDHVLKVTPGSMANMSGGFAGWIQDFALSGTFRATVTDGVTIQFTNIDVVATALDSINNQYPPGTVIKFTDLPTFPGTYNGLNFTGSIVNGPSYAGTFNGSSLAMRGRSLPLGICCDRETTVYSIGATVVPPAANPPTISGVWPNHGVTGSVVFLFGSNFIVPPARNPIVKFNDGTLLAPVVQTLAPDLLFVLQPAGTVQGKITVTTSAGTGISPIDYNAPVVPGLGVSGIWSAPGGFVVYVFGQGFSPIPGATKATVNGVSTPLLQVLSSDILFILLPSGVVTPPYRICITVGGQTVCFPDPTPVPQ